MAEGPETFFICLPNLETTNSDVMLVRSIQPDCVTVHIIDNDSEFNIYNVAHKERNENCFFSGSQQ